MRTASLLTLLICGPLCSTEPVVPPLADGLGPVEAQPHVSESHGPATVPPDFGIEEAILLGLIEGITEFLPISSTGHLILANHFLGLTQSEASLPSRNHENPHPRVDPTSMSEALDAYIIVIQFGAIIAVALLYRTNIRSIILGLLGRDQEGLFLARNLALAFFPAASIGLAFHAVISSYLFNIPSVILALFLGGMLMLWVENWRKRRIQPNQSESPSSGPVLHQLSPRQSLLIGFFQCVALWPGISRSMITIVGGYAVGLSPSRAAEFSFLLGLPTLSAAALYKILKSGPEMYGTLGWTPVLLGMGVAALSAAIAVKWMVSYLTSHGLAFFACYRIALALSLAVILLR